MSAAAIRRVLASGLRCAGRSPEVPFCLSLSDGSEVVVTRLLRVLPGKRIVGQGQWMGRAVLVKIFIAEASARHWSLEKAGIEMLCRTSLPTPSLVLACDLPDGGHILLTDYMADARSLAEIWTSVAALPAGSGQALAVLRPAFALLGRMHAQHLVHLDLHLGNFLCSGGALFVIDGDGVRSVAGDSERARLRMESNLALLVSQVPEGWSDSRVCLLEAYQLAGGLLSVDPGALEAGVERCRARRLRDYLAKTVRDCTLFSVRQTLTRFVSVGRDVAPLLEDILESPEQVMPEGFVLKDGRTCTVVRIEHVARPLVIKRYNLKSVWHALNRIWRPSRAWHAWREGHRLGFLGIATPEPLALVEERFGPMRRRAYLVTAYCPGRALQDLLPQDEVPEATLAKALVGLFQCLQKYRITHGDLKASNLLWQEGRIVLVDLDAAVQHRSEAAYLRAWRRDRSRFLRNWPATSRLCRWLDEHLPGDTARVVSDRELRP